jgi:hypothetical protein
MWYVLTGCLNEVLDRLEDAGTDRSVGDREDSLATKMGRERADVNLDRPKRLS